MNPTKLTDMTDLTELETLEAARPIIEAAGLKTIPDWIACDDGHIDGALRRADELKFDPLADETQREPEGLSDLADRFTSAHADYAALLATVIEVRDTMVAHYLTPDLAAHLDAAVQRATKFNKEG